MITAKIIHLLFVISWMAGVFYLPRVLVHLAEGRQAGEDVRRLLIMGAKLHRFTLLLAAVGTAAGATLWLYYGITGNWLFAKMGVVGLMFIYQLYCRNEFRRIESGGIPRSGKWYRLLNEVSVFFLLAILILVVAKPDI